MPRAGPALDHQTWQGSSATQPHSCPQMVTQVDRCVKGAGSIGLTLPQKEELQLSRLSLAAHPNSPLASQHHSPLHDSETPAQAKCHPTPSGRAAKQDGAPGWIRDFSLSPRSFRARSLSRSPGVPMPPAAPSTQLGRAWVAAWKSAAPPQNPG